MEIVITKCTDNIVCAWFDGNRLIQVKCCEPDNQYAVGNVYTGKVKNIVKNINVAFVDIGLGSLCFLEINNKDKLRNEDEIIVQVARDSTKNKQPVVTRNLSITGRYLILTEKKGINVSKKIKSTARKKELKDIFKDETERGFIVRTNAKDADDESIIKEKNYLLGIYNNIISKSKNVLVFSKLYTAPACYIEAVRDSYAKDVKRIVTDIPEVYNDIKAYMKDMCPEMKDTLSLYEDASYPLDLMFGVSERIKKALSKKVWLDSGAYIIIDVTEACVVIDVNSGKLIKGKKDVENTFFKINCEAAKEIMLQLRLRNLSGIIIIDFIDMKIPEYNSELIKMLKGLAEQDSVSCNVVDITKLGLVEITRKKQNRPLYEQFKLVDNKLTVI